jgi:hypothetical protein
MLFSVNILSIPILVQVGKRYCRLFRIFLVNVCISYIYNQRLKMYCCNEVLSRCATLFRALRTAAGGDGMRKKDTEIPHERVF